jgi:hypothetical protein
VGVRDAFWSATCGPRVEHCRANRRFGLEV